MKGLIFDIKDFAIHDGSGIRTTVFFKGCPLRCIWCHNPEGLSAKKQLYVKKSRCLECGLCRRECGHSDCREFGRCLHICPQNLVSIVGTEWEADALAQKLLKKKDLYDATGGGITLSGGEPLLQHGFAIELLSLLKGKLHSAIETCGYAETEVFKSVVSACDFVFMDIKLADGELHKKYTGVSNERILKNAEFLKNSGIPHAFRVPLIPAITDTRENLKAISDIVGESRVELLPYNSLAPSKYDNVGASYTDEIDKEKASAVDVTVFKNATLK